MPPEPPLNVIVWMIGEGKKDELDESDKVLLRPLCLVDNTTFLLPISAIGLILGDKPLLLIETRDSKDMKDKPELRSTEASRWKSCSCNEGQVLCSNPRKDVV